LFDLEIIYAFSAGSLKSLQGMSGRKEGTAYLCEERNLVGRLNQREDQGAEHDACIDLWVDCRAGPQSLQSTDRN
jgi:hypothetical protein